VAVAARQLIYITVAARRGSGSLFFITVAARQWQMFSRDGHLWSLRDRDQKTAGPAHV
jgi:hypothetical protein